MKKVTTLFAALVIVLFGASTMYAQTVVSISAAKDSTDGAIVTVKGIATTPSLESDSRTSFFIQQDGVGINIFKFGTPAKVIQAGDSVQVTGEVDTFNGLREIVVDDVTTDITVINSGNAVPEPMMISYQAFIDAGDPATDTLKLQGTLIRVNGLTTDPADWPTDSSSGSTNITATNSVDSTYNIRVLAQTPAMGTVPTAQFDIIGVIGSFRGSQISPRFETDIISYYNIEFSVDMSDIMDSAAFDPAEHEVFVTGSLNDWSETADELSDADDDSVFSKTILLKTGDYSYKFFTNSPRVGNSGYENDPVRSLTVSKDSTLATPLINVPYSDLSEATFGTVEIEFSVNMGVQILNESFNPETDVVVVAGSMNGWNTTSDTLSLSRVSDVYEGVVTVSDQAIPSSYGYKFVIKKDGNDNYESPTQPPLVDGNRKLDVAASDLDSESGNYLVDASADGTPFYSDVTFDDIFSADTDVVFKVDVRPVLYHLEDSLALPEDVQQGSVGADSTFNFLIGNGPLIAKGWEDWVPALGDDPKIRFNDAGTGGDAVAGDSVYSLTVSYKEGDARKGAFKLGVNGYDNEAGFGNDHSLKVPASNEVEIIFGAVLRSDGSVYDDLYDEYILATESGFEVVRRGGTGDGDVTVSNEDEINDQPKGFALEQNYPNPFNPSTSIRFTLPNAADVNLSVYNVLGQRVATLLNNSKYGTGTHTFNFDASNLASGIYIYRLEAGSNVSFKRMTLIK